MHGEESAEGTEGSKKMRLIDADEMAANESEAYVSAQAKIDSPITLALNSCVHRKIQQIIADTPTIDPEILLPAGKWVPVHKAKIVNGHRLFADGYECSRCHEGHSGRNYCEECGARMEE